MREKKLILPILVLIGLINNAPIYGANAPKLTEIAAKPVSQNLLTILDDTWQENPTNFNVIQTTIKKYLETAPKDIEDFLAPEIFENKKTNLFNFLLKQPLAIIGDTNENEENEDPITQFMFDPQEKYIFAIRGNSRSIDIWNLQTYEKIQTITENSLQPEDLQVEISNDGSKLLAYNIGGHNLVIRNREDDFANPTRLNKDEILEADFDPQNNYIIITQKDSIEILNNSSKEYEAIEILDIPPIEDAVFNFVHTKITNNYIIALAQDQDDLSYMCFIWQKTNLKLKPMNIKISGTFLEALLEVDNNENWVAISTLPDLHEDEESNYFITLINLQTLETTDLEISDVVNAITFNNTSTQLAAASNDENIYIWDLKNQNATPTTLTGHEAMVLNITFSPDDSLALSTSADETIRIWDIKNKKLEELIIIPGHAGESEFKIIFHPSDELFTCASEPSIEKLRLWFLPKKDTFNFDQIIILLALAHTIENPENLSPEEQKELVLNIQQNETYKELPEWLQTHIENILEKEEESEIMQELDILH